jgi:hypothetical protein
MAIVVPIVSDTSGLTRGLRGAGSSLSKFGRLAAVAIGVGVTAELYKSVKAAAEAEKSTQALRGQLKSLGMSSDVERLQEQFTQLATTLGVDDEAASRAFTTILKLTGSSTKAMEGLNLALDLSANTGFVDLEKQAMTVARAMNGNTRLFKQFGITVDENTTKQEALAIVQSRVQGQAESFGTSATGSFQRFNEAVENLRETIGAPLVIALANAGSKVAGFLNQLREKPTLETRIKFIISSIGNVAWTGIRSIYTWWDQQGRVELPAGVKLIPSGRQQFDAFFRSIEAAANQAGKDAAGLLIGSFSSNGRKQATSKLKGIFDQVIGVWQFTFKIAGGTLATKFVLGWVEVLGGLYVTIANSVLDALTGAVDFLTNSANFKELGGKLADGLVASVRKDKAKPSKNNVITDTVRAAVEDARRELKSFGDSLVSFMSQKRSALLRLPGGSNAAEITKEQRRIEDERFTIAEKAAREALATAEDKTSAQLDLDQLLLDRQQTLRDRAVLDAEASDKKTIDNLIEQFNRGEISADTFSKNLTDLIGADFGTELGAGFAGAFKREFDSVIALIASIASISGQTSVMAPTVPGPTAALQAENQRRYDEDLAKYKQRRAARLKAAEDAAKRADSRAGSRIDPGERAEIHRIMAAWDAQNRAPVRSTYGLAMGGILKKQVFTAGEAGAEAVIPLNSTSAMNMLRDAVGGGGGGTTNVYNLTVNAGLGTDPDELGRTIVESIKRYEKRNGAVFQGPIVTTLANAAGKTSTASAATDFNRAKTLRSG